jgi:hypothetical protein
MWIDTASERVVKLTYAPYALPPHATSGIVTETSGQAMPNFWYVVRIEESYQGRMLMIRGVGTFTGVFDHFSRFGSVTEGEGAIRDGSLGTTKS